MNVNIQKVESRKKLQQIVAAMRRGYCYAINISTRFSPKIVRKNDFVLNIFVLYNLITKLYILDRSVFPVKCNVFREYR